MKIKNRILCLALMFVTSIGLRAQEAIPATGGNASGSGGTASYTVGQVVYTTSAGATGSAVQGVQQSYEITFVSGIEEAGEITLAVSVYPNPATDYLTLKVKNYTNEELVYQLFNINGMLLESEKLTENETSIFMGKLLPAAYFIKVIHANEEIKTFKIIKK